ncbi:MAG: hypothetical protein GXO17_02420 [Thermodesulfobacteria bacterium]|nr:hypothetical protein [Thermodesulfobacteriota bacterium]
MKSLLTSLVKLDEVSGVLICREGRAVYTNLPDFYAPELQEALQQSLEEMLSAFRGNGQDQPHEVVSFYERGSLILREAHGFYILVILRTISPSPLVSVALNALALKFEKLAKKEKQLERTQELIPLVLFNEVVKLLTNHYGPAAKLIVKKALKSAEATEKGLPLSHLSLFLKALKQEIDDPRLAQMAINKAKEIVRLRRNS